VIVEDKVTIAMLLEATLADMGHGVCAVEGTEAGAVAAAARHRPDPLIVDARWSEGSGISAVDRILRDDRRRRFGPGKAESPRCLSH
jgi:CheY-like chemotaxis protein